MSPLRDAAPVTVRLPNPPRCALAEGLAQLDPFSEFGDPVEWPAPEVLPLLPLEASISAPGLGFLHEDPLAEPPLPELDAALNPLWDRIAAGLAALDGRGKQQACEDVLDEIERIADPQLRDAVADRVLEPLCDLAASPLATQGQMLTGLPVSFYDQALHLTVSGPVKARLLTLVALTNERVVPPWRAVQHGSIALLSTVFDRDGIEGSLAQGRYPEWLKVERRRLREHVLRRAESYADAQGHPFTINDTRLILDSLWQHLRTQCPPRPGPGEGPMHRARQYSSFWTRDADGMALRWLNRQAPAVARRVSVQPANGSITRLRDGTS